MLTLALGFGAGGHAVAQTNPQSSQAIETISITAARSPLPEKFVAGSINVIDERQIQASGAVSLADLLRSVPSVNISSSGPLGSLTEIRFRGSESNHVLVMLDGVEINDLGQGGLIDLSHLLLSNITRIEVLRGPQSALWGSAAISGVISITTKQNEADSDITAQAGVRYGNKATAQLSGAISGRSEALQYSISASHLQSNGENIAREGNEADGYRNNTFYATLAYEFSKYNRLSSNVRIVDYQNDFDSTDFSTGLLSDANNQTDGEQLSMALNWDFSIPQSIWSQRLSLQYSEQENINVTNDVFSGSTTGEKLRTVYNHNFQLSSGHINVGIEAISETFKQAGPILFGDPNQRQSNDSQSLIADMHQRLNNNLSVTASARYDNNEVFDNASSYRVGLNYQFTESIRGFISTGKAIKNPTFTERFGFFPGTFLGNNALVPESSESQEVGISATMSNFDIALSWYRATLSDEILGFVFDSDTGLFTAQNAELNSQREGLEFELSQTLQDWRWSFSYAYLDASEAEQTELRRAKHTGSAWVAYDINDKQSWYLQADYTGGRLDRFFPPFPQPSQIVGLKPYWLVSANYRYKLNDRLLLSLRLSNALNTGFEDVVGFSGESRRVLAALDYQF
jgi:vitamin B12 transporter